MNYGLLFLCLYVVASVAQPNKQPWGWPSRPSDWKIVIGSKVKQESATLSANTMATPSAPSGLSVGASGAPLSETSVPSGTATFGSVTATEVPTETGTFASTPTVAPTQTGTIASGPLTPTIAPSQTGTFASGPLTPTVAPTFASGPLTPTVAPTQTGTLASGHLAPTGAPTIAPLASGLPISNTKPTVAGLSAPTIAPSTPAGSSPVLGAEHANKLAPLGTNLEANENATRQLQPRQTVTNESKNTIPTGKNMNTTETVSEQNIHVRQVEFNRFRPRCGNGRVEHGEECDPPGECCTKSCRYSKPSFCFYRFHGRPIRGRCTGRSPKCLPTHH